MPKNPTLYPESTIIRCPTACPSQDLIVAERAGEEHLPGDFIFENEWQRFHTKKDQELKLKTPFHECNLGRYKISEKAVDIFGNTTMRIIEVSV